MDREKRACESYREAIERAREEMIRRYARPPRISQDALWRAIEKRANELFPRYEVEPQNEWRVESLEPHVPYRRSLIAPDGRVYGPQDYINVAQIAEVHGVSKRRVYQWGERINLREHPAMPPGSPLVAWVEEVLGFKPRPEGRPPNS